MQSLYPNHTIYAYTLWTATWTRKSAQNIATFQTQNNTFIKNQWRAIVSLNDWISCFLSLADLSQKIYVL